MAWYELVALVSGLLALIGLGVSWGIAWGSMRTKVDALWDIFMEAIKSRYHGTGLWESTSPRKLGKRGKEILSESLREEIEIICRKTSSPDVIISKLGITRLSHLAGEKGASLEEIIAAIGIYLEEQSLQPKNLWQRILQR